MQAPIEPHVKVHEQYGGRVARIVFEGPPSNALDLIMLQSLQTAVEALRGWDQLACVILEGAGRDFSTGFALAHRRQPYVSTLLPTFHAVVRGLASLDVMLVALVRGRCLGAAAELTLLCHTALADSTARMGFPEITFGAFPPLASLLLPGRVGPRTTIDWLTSGRIFQPDEALARGFLTEYAKGWETLENLTERFIEDRLLKQSNVALRGLARALRQPQLTLLNDDLGALEELYLKRIATSEDAEEGIDAALHNREPRWQHR